ncbi:MAG: hypothetical protein IH872_04255 [Chloroflexi bacterium]|nr:hypothetical protein [Chloroflexota bacterium]
MAQPQTIPLADLLADGMNPRLAQTSEGQRDTLRALAAEQGTKLTALARDIIEYGLNPGDPFYVIPLEDGSQRFVVVEGNRRLTALRALDNPDLFVGAIRPGLLTVIRRLSRTYQLAPIEDVNCTLFSGREEARHWVRLRHTGESRGAGTVRWRSDAASRFAAGTGIPPTETQALDFLERRGDITGIDRNSVPATTLRRLLDTPGFREKIGLGLQRRKLMLVAQEAPVAKALVWIVQGLISGAITEPKITTVQDRIKFADNLPADIVVTPTAKGGGVDIATVGETIQPERKATSKTVRQKPRKYLIPGDCVINITDERLRRIEVELRRLDLEDFTNSVGVMLRVFIELSGDTYLARTGLRGVAERDVLSKKLTAITKDLQSQSKLTDKQATPVLKACVGDSLLAPSIKLMNEYVHNPYLFPSASDLRTAWDNLQPFITAVWEA